MKYDILMYKVIEIPIMSFVVKLLEHYYSDNNIYAYTEKSINTIMVFMQENFYDLINLWKDADSIYDLDDLYDDMYLDVIRELKKNAELPIYKTYKTIDGEITLDLCEIAEYLVLSQIEVDYTEKDINHGEELTEDSFYQLQEDLIPIIGIFTCEAD